MDVKKEIDKLEKQFDDPTEKIDEPVRINIKIGKSIKTYFEKRAKETGSSQSALMSMALSEYIDQKRATNVMSDLSEIIKAETEKLAAESKKK